MSALGWWVIAGEQLLDLLQRAAAGEDPDLLYTEAYANTTIERQVEGGEGSSDGR